MDLLLESGLSDRDISFGEECVESSVDLLDLLWCDWGRGYAIYLEPALVFHGGSKLFICFEVDPVQHGDAR